ncbi:hypothetical protein [Roseateles violae]|uniref:Uncharacterized protein n=1 Tax=Roseateles violae TaxID=3058042 RepID=A0ABT8DS82_9BURK|nr:hypothetical protein [Pelomonas sp. PFR6]MDN3921185.1 hypothetical protein [Pelomonas sp. PFR6]
MSANLTPEEARKASNEMLTQWANTYRSDSGVYRVVVNEIDRRAEVQKNWRKVGVVVVIGLLGVAFFWLRHA